MIETLIKAAEVTAMKSIENLGKNFEFRLPDLVPNKQEVTDAALDARAEAAAHSASKFFNLPEAKIQKGDTIGVYKNGEGTFLDDVFEYNLDQFKRMNCTSFEDMTKVWAHECGHRLLQNIFPNSWADELGADFFAGARSEMLGLPKSNFEKLLGSTTASKSHPGGALRMQAMDYGRFVVTQMKKAGIQPTWENCIEAYMQSPFAKMTYENTGKGKATGFINNKAYHYGNAADAQAKVNWNLKHSKDAVARGDYKLAKDYAYSSSRWQNTVKDETRAANRSTKFVDGNEGGVTGFIDNKAYHYGNAADAQAKVNSNLKRSQEAAARGDYKLAKDYAQSASRWQNTVKDETRAANRSTKFVDGNEGGVTGFIDNKAYHYGNAADAQSKVNSNLKRSQEAAERGDFRQARDYARSASRWQTTVKDETRAANRSTKLIDDGQENGNSEITSFVNDRAWHLKNAEQAKANSEYYLNESKKAAARGDYGKAKDHAKTAESYGQKAKDEVSAAKSSSK